MLGNEMPKGWYRVELTRKSVWMVFPSERLGDFFKHELRWSELFSSTRTVLSTSPLNALRGIIQPSARPQ